MITTTMRSSISVNPLLLSMLISPLAAAGLWTGGKRAWPGTRATLPNRKQSSAFDLRDPFYCVQAISPAADGARGALGAVPCP